MSLPDEKVAAVRNTGHFLRLLMDSKATPRVPLKIRAEARRLLRHFPWETDLMAIEWKGAQNGRQRGGQGGEQ